MTQFMLLCWVGHWTPYEPLRLHDSMTDAIRYAVECELGVYHILEVTLPTTTPYIPR